MKGDDLLRGVQLMRQEKNISEEVIFEGIEAAVHLAIQKHFGDEEGILVSINRKTGEILAQKGEEIVSPQLLGRIAAQSAKQVMIQKIREAECNAVFDEYSAQKGDLVHGAVQRFEGGAGLVTLGKSEAILPRSEQIPGETHHVGDRIKAVILDVRKAGHRVKIVLSRTHPDFVRRLFENEIPEIADHTIEIKAVARESGYRSKVAVSSIDSKVDCVGACVGVRGSRIKNIVDELGGERIDIVRWNESLQVLIPYALQPAQIEEVQLYARLGRAIVLVKDDQLSLAIGRRGQNVRLASKLVGWDIEIMTYEELAESIEKADTWFNHLPHAFPEMVEAFIVEGFLSFADLYLTLEAPQLAEMTGLTEEQAAELLAFAEEASDRMEEEAKTARTEEEPRQEPASLRPTAAERAAELLPGDGPIREVEVKPTLETLFGPDNGSKPEEARLSATQLLGEAPPPDQPEEAPQAEGTE